MTKILHILDHSLPLHSGYTFRTRAILKSQIAHGWQVQAITGLRQYQHGQVAGANFQQVDDIIFHRTLGKTLSKSPMKEWQEVQLLTQHIVKLHKQYPFHIMHAHSPALNGLAAARASDILGIPFIYEIRAFWEDAAVGNGTGSEGSAKYRLTRALENHVMKRADHITVICQASKDDLIARGISGDKILVSPNGVDFKLFSNTPKYDEKLADEMGLKGKKIFGFIGSFYDYEGIDDLISALAILIKENEDARLLLVGGGPMEDALKAQVRALNLDQYVIFTGRVPHEQVERYYGLMDMMVYPRKMMRLTDLVTPLKPLEAMAQDRLVVASDVGGHRELIRDKETGFLFKADDPANMAACLTHVLTNKENWPKIRETAKNYVLTERDWAQNIKCYDPVYHFLLSKMINEKAA
ncbi:glycosyltransferase, exosortase A system-associated [Sphingorhabdus lutea]|uniref:Glycosyltransferase, exosortase A system-associated n=1 Tax=Sphingorhabdus lutea TaxID=1913578 RepID=A0A1L3JAI9_9SPHN|nr:TIGR04063 family PEP-CTERM/XrtA system glycosyltransferase [Sphingorhabdus lutea]APG62146.1 glycosyltransferase, exosortase A system-associated [Sphingorhabdus lutea]